MLAATIGFASRTRRAGLGASSREESIARGASECIQTARASPCTPPAHADDVLAFKQQKTSTSRRAALFSRSCFGASLAAGVRGLAVWQYHNHDHTATNHQHPSCSAPLLPCSCNIRIMLLPACGRSLILPVCTRDETIQKVVRLIMQASLTSWTWEPRRQPKEKEIVCDALNSIVPCVPCLPARLSLIPPSASLYTCLAPFDLRS